MEGPGGNTLTACVVVFTRLSDILIISPPVSNSRCLWYDICDVLMSRSVTDSMSLTSPAPIKLYGRVCSNARVAMNVSAFLSSSHNSR